VVSLRGRAPGACCADDDFGLKSFVHYKEIAIYIYFPKFSAPAVTLDRVSTLAHFASGPKDALRQKSCLFH
jgi:hypothetical protein